MAKLKISPEFRKLLSEKIMDLGNLVITGLAVGQFVSNGQLSIPEVIGGLIIGILCYILSFLITQK